MKVDPSDAKLGEFRVWLVENGRSELTADYYAQYVARAAEHKSGVVGRLTERGSAPKTLHLIAAALRSYATFTEDGDLIVAVKRIRLPPAKRAKPRVELAYQAWGELVRAIQKDKKLRPVDRAVLEIMALRGLRIGDALRLRRSEIKDALRTGRLGYEAKGRSRLDYKMTPALEAALTTIDEIDAHWDRVVDLVSRSSKATGDKKIAAGRIRILRELKRIASGIRLEGVYNHRLRRTYATHFVRKLKGDPQAIMKLQAHMGWATPATAMQYVDAVNHEDLDILGEALVDDLLGKPPRPKKPRRR